MILKPFNYFGSKQLIASCYPKPKYSVIYEPFAGSAGYSCWYHDLDIRLSDANFMVVGVWDYLIKTKGSEIRKLPIEVTDTEQLNCCQEAKWLIGFWIQASCASPARKPSSWMKSQMRPDSYWGPVIREQVANIADKIKHWKVRLCDYASVEDANATWFIDPPYATPGGRTYTAQVFDYQHLASWCQSRSGQVIVCEEQGSTWLPFKPFGDFKSNPNSKRTAEVIWTNERND